MEQNWTSATRSPLDGARRDLFDDVSITSLSSVVQELHPFEGFTIGTSGFRAHAQRRQILNRIDGVYRDLFNDVQLGRFKGKVLLIPPGRFA